MTEPSIETPTFKRIRGRWHIAQLCMTCRVHIWRDVHDKPLSDSAAPYCEKCLHNAGIVQRAPDAVIA